MSDLLRSMKSDLLSRRMLPLLALATAALIAAVAYAALAGSAAKPKTVAPPARIGKAQGPEGPAVSSAPANPDAAVAETTSGVAYQHGGTIHNPFAPLPGSGSTASAPGARTAVSSSLLSSGKPAPSSSSSSTGASTKVPSSSGTSSPPPGESSGSSTQGSSTQGSSSKASGPSSGSSGSGAPEASRGPRAELYEVNMTWQRLSSSGAPAGARVQLAGIDERLAELPSKHHPLLAYVGVSRDTHKAVFLLLVPPILHGEAKCLPGPNNCELIALEAKQSEEMQYLQPDGEVVAYELTLDSIAKSSMSANAAAAKAQAVAPEGRRLLERLHLAMPQGISFSVRQDALLGVGSLLARSAKAHR